MRISDWSSDVCSSDLATLDAPETHGRSYALPGGETLAYSEMVTRVLATLQPPAKLHVLPPAAFRALLSLAHAGGVARGDRQSVVSGKSVSVRVDLGCRPRHNNKN